MENKVNAQPPIVELATKDWTVRELMDTERRIEKGFHEQTQFLSQRTDAIEKGLREQMQQLSKRTDAIERGLREQIQQLSLKMDSNTRWMVGLILTMTITIIMTILFKG